MALKRRIQSFQYKTDKQLVFNQAFEDGLVDELVFQRLTKLAKLKSTEHPLEILLSNMTANKPKIEVLCEWHAKKHNIEFIKIDPMKLEIERLVNLISHAFASRLQILPISVTESEVVFVTGEPSVLEWVPDVERAIKKKIIVKAATPTQIRTLLQEIFVVQKAFSSMNKDRSPEQRRVMRSGNEQEFNQMIEKSRLNGASSQDNSAAQIVNWLLNFADLERASDIHIEPKKGMGSIRFRVDGKLRVVYRLDPEALQTVVARFKILGSLKMDEKRLPQDGQVVHYLRENKKIEIRLSTVPCQFGEKMVIRIFNKNASDLNLDFIGFNDGDREIWEDLINQNQGLLLVTGPTGSGKSTTLYSSLSKIATQEVNVCTVEDPIEMTVDGLNQVQVNSQIGLGFAECMRSFLRQDPDVIMVGEIRDQETGEMAIQASLTGHLVLATVHTNGALQTIQRLLDLGLPSYLLNTSLSGILAQRLVRKLCPHCCEKIPTPPEQWKSLVKDLDIKMPETVMKAKGCDECKDTGFEGRFCIYELVKINEKIRSFIHSTVEIETLKAETSDEFIPIRANAAKKVAEGKTSLEEVLAVVY
jgi:general secretion pathway protein E